MNSSCVAAPRRRGCASRRVAILFAIVWLGFAAAGCDDVEWAWEPPRRVKVIRPSRDADGAASPDRAEPDRRTAAAPAPQQPQRTSAEPIPLPKDSAREATATPGTAAHAAASPARSPASADAPVQPPPAQPVTMTAGEIGRVDLVSGDEAGGSALPGARVVRHLSARGCGRLLERLYDPLGRGGSPQSYYLVYQDQPSRAAAAEWAERLDRAADAGAASGSADWGASVRSLAEWMEQIAPPAAEEVRRIEDALTRAAERDPATIGWAAYMLAGSAAMELRYDFDAARGYLRQAARIAATGSLEQMMATWRMAQSYEEQGARQEHRETCRSIAESFAAHDASHVVQRARVIAREP